MEVETASSHHKRDGSMSSVASSVASSPDGKRELFEFFGWVFHLGVNSIGHEYCHLRFLFIRGKYVEMYKRDPHENPGIRPIRRGVIGPSLMVEELGRRKVNDGDVYVIRFYSRLDETKKGELGKLKSGWKLLTSPSNSSNSVILQYEQAVYELSRGGSARDKLNVETEINLAGHRPRVRRYAHELKRLIRIGQGPETLLRRSSTLGNGYFQSNAGDVIEANDWKCVRTINGTRILEDVSDSKAGKSALVKAVAVIEASADTIFEMILNLERHHRYEWDTFSGDLELVDSYDGHYDVVYGTFDPKYLTRWTSKKDFVFSRQWFRAQDGTYSLKEYVEANPVLKSEAAAAFSQVKVSDLSSSNSDYEDINGEDEFYDAVSADSSSSEGSDDEETDEKVKKVRLKNVSWAIAGLALKKLSGTDARNELDRCVAPISIDLSNFRGSLARGKDDSDKDCWSSPSGDGFAIRGKDYLRDNTKVKGSNPLLQLIAVDWLKVDGKLDNVALHPKCLVQSEAGKKLPFILVINLQVPAKPNYSLVCYFAADRPVSKKSLLAKFVNGTDAFRDARFKLIPSIIEGYWMVKRAVGTKACLLGKAVTCNYLRQDNFLEIDVDIGSSSVARSVIGLVLGYVTSIVVDLAILIEAKEETELPEYILGTVRLNRLKPESAVQFGV
ncbi:hypothetical protein CDL15_Pgr015224 [Punica granatum]|uniref:START domain-containing protein n=1 Tax=Punica granatum TaxID=22663 RepID=A0A218VZV3_PUNGR|nr:hypothetical protein CDL15_Pgr015224 [Punica granatum]